MIAKFRINTHRAYCILFQVGNCQSILCFDAPDDYLYSYKRWMKQAASEAPVPPVQLTPDDHLVLIYTSGTTGAVGVRTWVTLY